MHHFWSIVILVGTFAIVASSVYLGFFSTSSDVGFWGVIVFLGSFALAALTVVAEDLSDLSKARSKTESPRSLKFYIHFGWIWLRKAVLRPLAWSAGGILLGLVALLLQGIGYIAFTYAQPYISRLDPMQMIRNEWAIVSGICAGVLFYLLRGKRPLIYGIAEATVGLITLRTSVYSENADALTKGIGFLAGVYIIVRGMDNMDRGLPEKWRPLWDRWFPKRKQSRSP